MRVHARLRVAGRRAAPAPGSTRRAIAPDPAATLNARYAALKDELSHSQFGRPVYLDSSETKDAVTGEIFALVNHPFAAASAALDKPSEWCDILILHLNTKYCRPSTDSKGTVLHVSIGKKLEQPLSDAYRRGLFVSGGGQDRELSAGQARCGAGPARHARLSDRPRSDTRGKRADLHPSWLFVFVRLDGAARDERLSGHRRT